MSKAKGEVSFEAGGERYTLVYSINALCAMEDKMGASVNDIAALASAGKRFNTIRTVFWAGLVDNHSDLTMQDAGRIITDIGIEKADALVAEGFSLTFPESKVVPLEGKPVPAQRRARTG